MLEVGDKVTFDASEFPWLGLPAGMEGAEMVITAVQPDTWYGHSQIRVEWDGREFALLDNAVTLA